MAQHLSAGMSRETIDEYSAACTALRKRVESSITDTLHPLYAEALASEAEGLWMTDKQTSIRVMERAIAMLRGLTPPCRSAWAGRMYGNLAYEYYELGQLREAVDLYGESIQILTSLQEPPLSLTASQYLFLGLAFRRSLMHEQAASAFAEAARWQEQAGDTVSMAEALSWYADARFHLHDFDGAEANYLRCCDLLRRTRGEQAEETLGAMQELATCYIFLAKFDDARRILGEVQHAINRPGAAYDPILVSFVHTMTAQVCADLGLDSEAESWFAEAAKIVDMIPASERPMYKAMVTNNTASFLAARDRQEEAAALIEQSLRIMDTSPWRDVEHFKARANSNLGSVYSELKRYSEAETLLVNSVAMYEKVFGPASIEMAAPLSNLGMVYRDQQRYTEARAILSRAREIGVAVYGAEHPLSARLLRNLASVELEAHSDSSALAMLRTSYDELLHWYDPWHVETLDCLQLLGKLILRHPAEPDAPDIMRNLVAGTVRRMRDSFEFESEARQLDLYERFASRNLGIVARWAMKTESGPSASEILLDAITNLKGSILAENVRFHSSSRGRQQEGELLDALRGARERYASLATKNPSGDLLALRQRLSASIDSLDAALRKINGNYDKQRRIMDADWRDAQRLLRRDEALIEYLIAPPSGSDSGRVLLAVVLRSRCAPDVIRLCEEQELETALLATVSERIVSLFPEKFRMQRLAALIWDPLTEALNGMTNLIIVPDGVLHRVAFAALVVDTPGDSLRVLDDIARIQHIGSLRDLLSRSPSFTLRSGETASRFCLIGNPDFGEDDGTRRKGPHWSPLPGTAMEIGRIEEVCRQHSVTVEITEGKAATEHYVKELSASPFRVLHIATHGFFFPIPHSGDAAPTSPSPEPARGRESFRIDDHPLLRSGLILAGANKAWSGEPVARTEEDGILTALEISRLDLSSTELVVLSACETALGDIRTGEGVFGLQRSVLSAGAASLLMSLWKVPDEPTAELMASFYNAWLTGAKKSDALRQARTSLRTKYPDPMIWAPFVLVGE